ncbi:hypothetical protein PRIPAC_80718 [Pristionchus pacificus]|uniref:Arm_2 domain-containing protein n=1 Tax=Pristionchus pacificus TaxID=54126 RepID=A0A2A6BEJ6_PRIPA|nr:hypothetical protein PRIPAC_80718 [Pristionchus pacificus]|eukprot:PDM64231.1 hypothetical protein PRIPAC_54475 [Pristionchus pacificus]
MGQQQSGFVVEIASPRLGRFQALPQKDPEDEEISSPLSSPVGTEWRIISNPCSEMFGTQRLRGLIQKLYKQQKLFNEGDAKLMFTSLHALDPAADILLPLLTVISNATAIQSNQVILRENGITHRISEMVSSGLTLSKGGKVMLMQCLANMAVSKENHKILSPCIPRLIDRISSGDETEGSVAMQALTNLSIDITKDQIEMYSRCIPRVLSRVWLRGEPSLDALRLLVNLSCCPDLVPHILGSKIINGILCVLDTDKTEILIRAITWILCMSSAVDALHITYDKLGPFIIDPFGNPSHTLFHAIFGYRARNELEKRVELLVKHPQPDISKKCLRLLEILSQASLLFPNHSYFFHYRFLFLLQQDSI